MAVYHATVCPNCSMEMVYRGASRPAVKCSACLDTITSTARLVKYNHYRNWLLEMRQARLTMLAEVIAALPYGETREKVQRYVQIITTGNFFRK